MQVIKQKQHAGPVWASPGEAEISVRMNKVTSSKSLGWCLSYLQRRQKVPSSHTAPFNQAADPSLWQGNELLKTLSGHAPNTRGQTCLQLAKASLPVMRPELWAYSCFKKHTRSGVPLDNVSQCWEQVVLGKQEEFIPPKQAHLNKAYLVIATV